MGPVDLVALADLSPTLLGQVSDQYGIEPKHRYATITEMLAGVQLDGVILLTSGSHGGPALEAIDAGVAVFCEKPLAFSLAEIELLRKAERNQGRPMLLLGYMKEYDPAVRTLKSSLAAGADLPLCQR